MDPDELKLLATMSILTLATLLVWRWLSRAKAHKEITSNQAEVLAGTGRCSPATPDETASPITPLQPEDHTSHTPDSSARGESSREAATSLNAALFEELVSTEIMYVRHLRTMVRCFARPAQKLSILSAEDKNAIFSNSEALLMCAEALLDGLQKSGEVEEVWAEAFLSVAPFFKLYSVYCRNYVTALQAAQRCRAECDGFKDFLLSQAAGAPAHSQSWRLEDFLILPVQRLTKYPLFFQDLLRGTAQSHPQYAKVLKAQEVLISVNASVNAAQSAQSEAMQQLLGLLGHRWHALVEPHRRLLFRFKCKLTWAFSDTCDAQVFLFDDLLLLCEQRTPRRSVAAALRPVLLAELKSLIWGEEVVEEDMDGDRQMPIAEHHTDISLPVRVMQPSPRVLERILSRAAEEGPPDAAHSTELRWRRRSLDGMMSSSPTYLRLELLSNDGAQEIVRTLQNLLEKASRTAEEARRPERHVDVRLRAEVWRLPYASASLPRLACHARA
jgi:hypothetical protein